MNKIIPTGNINKNNLDNKWKESYFDKVAKKHKKKDKREEEIPGLLSNEEDSNACGHCIDKIGDDVEALREKISEVKNELMKRKAQIWNNTIELNGRDLNRELKVLKDKLSQIEGDDIVKESEKKEDIVQLSILTDDQKEKVRQYWLDIFPDDPEFAEALAKDY